MLTLHTVIWITDPKPSYEHGQLYLHQSTEVHNPICITNKISCELA